MIRFAVVLLAAATPAAAQIAPLSFEAGKALPLAPGQWSHIHTAGGSIASFGSAVTIRCDRATRTITIDRPGAASGELTIATSSLTRGLPIGGRLLANDPLLDAIAFSRGRFLLSGGSGPTLAIPAWPEAARSIEDCRN
jgi:polyisoprenoid-binding protein YceI